MNYPRHRAITTRYKGFAFRSRLEARWAIFLDTLGVRWDYEPEGFELGNGLRYLPDFWLPDWDMWLEVKPDNADDVTLEKARRLVAHVGKPVYISAGMPDRNGTLAYQTIGHDVCDLPAFAYFQADAPIVLCFSDDYGPVDHRCRKIQVHSTVFDAERARAGASPGPVAERALFAARSARFEFGAVGA